MSNIKEKGGDLLIDIAKLVIGGVILSGIVSENINKTALYAAGVVFALTLVLLGFILYKHSEPTKKRRK